MSQAYPPTVEIKRAILTQKRDEFRAMAYGAEVDVETLLVQVAVSDDQVDQQVTNLKQKADNCYRSARRLDEMLAKLPKPPKDAK